MLVVSIILYIITSIMINWRLWGKVTLNRLVVVFYFCAIVINTLTAQILSLAGVLDRAGLYLLLQTVLCAIVVLIVLDPAKKLFYERLPKIRFNIEKLNGLDVALVALMVIILAGYFVVGQISPINNSDSLHTHLPRIYYWIQHGSMANWDAVTTTQITYPIIIPIQGVWLFLLGNSERWFYLVQWYSLAAAVVLVYETALLMGSTQRGALVAGLVVLSFPGVLLQVFSLQGDVFIAAALMGCVYLVMRYVKTGSKYCLILSTLPLVIALGAKQTAFLFLPVYAAAIVVLLWKKRDWLRTAVRMGMVFAVSFGLLSTYQYIQNGMNKQETEGSMFATYRYAVPFTQGTTVRWYATNTMRYGYQWVSLDGLNGQMKVSVQDVKNDIFRWVSGALNLDLETHEYISAGDDDYFQYNVPPVFNEDASWFGLLSWTLIPAAVIVGLVRKDKIHRLYSLAALVLLAIYFFSTAILIIGWSPTNGRYMIIPVILATPLAAFLIPRKRGYVKLAPIVVATVSVYLAFSTLLINENRPIITDGSLYKFQYDVIEKMDQSLPVKKFLAKAANRIIEDVILTCPSRKSILQVPYYEKLFFQNTDEVQEIEFVNAHLQPSTPLYLNIKKTTLEYGLFGINRSRELYPVSDLDDVPAGSYVLVSKHLIPEDSDDFGLIAENSSFSILQKQ